ncbi:MAG: UDP-N-acetylmuramoyl-tripeptide--D-alanyl-D-alanine ligase [Sandaracinus sp.]|nr:UDP-N-acetylmuramoyl-tripeptide--D-alanyl-D-alanine ligase [Sandaracinus sp.]
MAITGSAGKTSTKELTVAALRGAGYDPTATVGNLNNLVGVPMTLFTLGDDARFAVVEMGTNAVGEIAKLGAMARADVGVVTLVAAAHTEGIGTEEDVFAEKTSLLGTLRAAGKSIVNADDARLRRVADAYRYGRDENADVRMLEWDVDGPLTHARWSVRGHFVDARLRLVGEAAARNGAAALAVAMVLGVDVDAAASGMAELAPVAGRMSPRGGVGGALVLDDTYNANPSSVLLALRTAKTVADARGGRLVAVLGDMKELGALSREKHAEVRSAAEAVAQCVFVGPEMGAVGAAVGDASAAIEALPALGESDVVLVKGSRSMALEQVVEAVLARGEVAR